MELTGKVDLKKELKELYSPSAKKCGVVDVPALNILYADGAGDPNTSPAFSDAISALYTTAYTLKFMLKGRDNLPDFTVMPLEAQWWSPTAEFLNMEDKDSWSWRALIVQPDHVTGEMVEMALAEARRKKDLPALDQVRFDRVTEGLSAQILHVGPYAAERPTIERLHAFIADQGFALAGKHHEIYLSDPKRTEPAKLKTIVRQPIARPS